MMAPTILRASESVRVATKRLHLAPLESKLTAAMRKAFRSQQRAFMMRLVGRKHAWPSTILREALQVDEWEMLFTEAELATLMLFEEPLGAFARAALDRGLRVTLAQMDMGTSLNLENPRAVQYLQTHAAERVAGINETTRAELRKILVQATEEGWSYQRTAKAIIEKYDRFSVGVPGKRIRSRAEVIALTEIGDGYEEAIQIVGHELTDAGLDIEKLWSTMVNPCPVCSGNRAQGWIPFDRPFGSGHVRPLSHPSCRCSLRIRRIGSAA